VSECAASAAPTSSTPALVPIFTGVQARARQ
jgi:hypothetical protein